jgi:hypothetical protein
MVDHRDDDQKQGEPAYSTEDDPPPISLSPSPFGIAQATRSSSVDHEVAVSRRPSRNYASTTGKFLIAIAVLCASEVR